MIEEKQFDGQTEAALRQQDVLNAEMPIEDEMIDIDDVDTDDRKYLELMFERAEKGIEPLPDDPTVRAAVNALILENRGF